MGTYNGLLHTCVRTRELGSARRLLGRMAQDGIAPDADTFMHECSLHIMSREYVGEARRSWHAGSARPPFCLRATSLPAGTPPRKKLRELPP